MLCVSLSGCLDDEQAQNTPEPTGGGFVDDNPGGGGFVDDEPDVEPPAGCGDGTLDTNAGEVCEGADLNGASCDSLGLGEGTLACTTRCTFNTSGCAEPLAQSVCGDGTLADDEVCEPGRVTQSCADLDDFDGGELGCTTECTLDTSACTSCGDGRVQGDELCDGDDLAGQSCEALNPERPFGALRCHSDCTFDTSACDSFRDQDGDGVADADDPAVDDFTVCGDDDDDGCDDCSLRGQFAPEDDGLDTDGDGRCELPLDYDCMNGENADQDPNRLDACIMLTHVNNDRAHFSQESNNAAPVAWSEEIWAVAMAHSRDMCDRGFFDHRNPDGQSPSDRAAEEGLNFGVAENIALNFDAGAAQYAFMNEPTCVGHRGNILDPRMTEVGIGYHVCDRPTSEYRWGEHHHVTQNFRMNFMIGTAPYCSNDATHCEVPADPPTTAVCPDQLIQWGFCPTPSADMLPQWGCQQD